VSALLEIRGLRVAIGAQPVLRGVDLEVHPGQVAGLVGESGAGKSMVGRTILGLLPGEARVTGGSVRFDGLDLLAAGTCERADLPGRDIALIPQNPMTALNPVARIEAQMTDVLRMHLKLSRVEAQARALEMVEAVHLREPRRVLRQYPHELSGGMRQRVLIATAFACRPRLVVADEPTTALDVTVQRQCLRLIRELQAAHGTALLFVTHDLGVVAKLCDTVSVIHAGRILETGAARAVFEAPRHPYTRALLGATPRWDRPAEALEPIPDALLERLWDEARAADQEEAA
jgi:peptide/nickel transport system ATP-binding protein